jgi:ABC-type amino acid transport substrate-binding protein
MLPRVLPKIWALTSNSFPPKGDVDTLNYFNNWIGYVAAEGWLKERIIYWFETKDWESRIQ